MPAPRPYPNLLRAVREGLSTTFETGRYADRVVTELLRSNPRWGSRDRGFIAETIYDIVRWWRLLAHLADSEEPGALIAAYWWWRHGEVLDLPGFAKLDERQLSERLAFAKTRRPLAESIPDWLDLLGQEELGDQWPATIRALNEQAPVYLRVNTLKANREQVLRELTADGFEVEAESRAADAIKVLARRNLWSTKSFKDGHFEVQDIASQLVAPALEVAPGMTVIDACAGAGGKTLHLAALMQNKGRLIALDTEEYKLAELKRRASRADVQNLDIRHISSTKVIKRLAGKADRVLLDVPCSGLGVLRRNPDAKWKVQPGFLAEVRALQADILSTYATMLKPGGKLVYATCSILPSESEQQVRRYIDQHLGMTLEASQRLSPVDGYDGFYWGRVAALR